MNLDVTVIIRAAGERTELLCQYIVEQQVPSKQVFVIHERPFWKAVKRTFEIGINEGRRWTLAVDADVLLSNNAIKRMVSNAEKIDKPLFCYQGYVQDFIFGCPRDGGPHLYNSKFIPDALEILKTDSTIHRPESDTYKVLAAKGIYTIVDSMLFGVHDYYQNYDDYYRKAFFHAIKTESSNNVPFFFNNWVKNINKSIVYEVLINGWLKGKKDGNVEVDIDFFRKVTSILVLDREQLSLEENEYSSLVYTIEELISSQSNIDLKLKIFPNKKSTVNALRHWLAKKIFTIGYLIKPQS